ncbi:hypothetical protein EYF80_024417 [Liparis tanakae]|uniref:Uncharacterized protein n=1 Tax=Liparis tanakae TaxID=230148 RepID=A0A4Z2HIH6_9TELE|nr:hypothetical protein EYF80_024417 [Liparis tanakae]
MLLQKQQLADSISCGMAFLKSQWFQVEGVRESQKILKPFSRVSVAARRLLWALDVFTVTSLAVAGVGSSL